ncbi:MAG: M28 family peptidase [Thermodesulfovibrionales bacterium]|nr:M28 family peptidase [Thermodesulfovibrionales bacterium]
MEEIRSNLEHIVYYISEKIGQRSYLDIEKLNTTALYIERMLLSYGCKTERQDFFYRNNLYANIIGEVEGYDKEIDEIIVIGAHYDTVVGTPGADDNASGIAGLLELARLTSLNPMRRTVKFVAFCLEEPPVFMTNNMGSYLYAKSLKEKKVNIYGMICLEMIGYFTEKDRSQYYPFYFFNYFYPKKGNFIALIGNISSLKFTQEVKNNFKRFSTLAIESLNSFSMLMGVDFSDHRNFWKFGYPAFMVTDTGFYRNPYYHAKGDTASTLDYSSMEEVVKGLYNALKIL